MGVTHSMEENQVKRISTALNRSAEAIQGINTKFDLIDEHVQKMLDFNRTTNSKVHRVLSSFERLDDTFNDRAEKLLESLVGATNTLTDVLEAAAVSLDKVNIRRELDNIPKAMITLAIPFIILIIELAVSNAYHGILLASLPGVNFHYSNYLVVNASATLMGLFLSLLWLVCYRVWLSTSCNKSFQREKTEHTLQRLSRLRTRSLSFHNGRTDSEHTNFSGSGQGEASPGFEMEDSEETSEFARRSRCSDSLSRAKARRIERKLQRNMSGEDEELMSSPELSPSAPYASPAPMGPVPLSLPPLHELHEEIMSRTSEQELAQGLARADEIAMEAASQAAGLEAASQAPVPQEATGEAVRPRRSPVAMRWEKAFQLDMTWGGRESRSGLRSSTSLEPPRGGSEGVSEVAKGLTSETF